MIFALNVACKYTCWKIRVPDSEARAKTKSNTKKKSIKKSVIIAFMAACEHTQKCREKVAAWPTRQEKFKEKTIARGRQEEDKRREEDNKVTRKDNGDKDRTRATTNGQGLEPEQLRL